MLLPVRQIRKRSDGVSLPSMVVCLHFFFFSVVYLLLQVPKKKCKEKR
jgi:hypothetical protein